MTKEKIRQLAIDAGCPRGWYEGPWFKGDKMMTGVPDCLSKLAKLIEADVKKTTR